jgi:hypothetical protein
LRYLTSIDFNILNCTIYLLSVLYQHRESLAPEKNIDNNGKKFCYIKVESKEQQKNWHLVTFFVLKMEIF